MTKRGLLIVFSGPSGVGKDTILRQFLQGAHDCALSVSATTRPPRDGEVDSRDYHFITKDEFRGLIDRGEMLEYAEYNGNFYGTPRSYVDAQLRDGKNVILEIEVQGAMNIKNQRPDAVFVFVMPPDWDSLRRRLENRGTETADSLAGRLALARRELGCADQYDYILVNDDLTACCESLGAVITAAGCAVGNMKEFIEEVRIHA